MNPIKERVKVELDELQMRLTKLKRFVESERITTVSDEMADLLRQQYAVMQQYRDILKKRITLMEDSISKSCHKRLTTFFLYDILYLLNKEVQHDRHQKRGCKNIGRSLQMCKKSFQNQGLDL